MQVLKRRNNKTNHTIFISELLAYIVFAEWKCWRLLCCVSTLDFHSRVLQNNELLLLEYFFLQLCFKYSGSHPPLLWDK